MSTVHVVQQGEHLAGIARKHGFRSHKTLWDLPENKALRDKQKNPNILLPGDEVTIPERTTKDHSGATEARHRFTSSSTSLLLRIVLKDLKNKPEVGNECTLVVEGDKTEFTTDDKGMIEQPITVYDGSGQLKDRGPAGAQELGEVQTPFTIGTLDPVDSRTGQVARLNNLGYLAGDLDAPSPTNDAEQRVVDLQFKSAVEEFQCDHGLSVDGVCGPKSQQKLIEAHGC
jgi:hypothetical protein